MAQAALKITPVDHDRVAAVAKFRELADRLERGELEGARIQWRVGFDHSTVVEVEIAADEKTAQVRLYQSFTDGRQVDPWR